MATTKKPKTAAAKTTKSKTASKPKTTAKTAAKTVAKPVSEAPEAKTEKVVENKKEESVFKGFFKKKYDEKESILTIFKKPKLYGALLGEVLGTACMTMFLFGLLGIGIANMAMFSVVYIAIVVAVFAISGAQLNPIITAGMMATRRMSVIRGVLYIIAQVVGAWLGWMVFNSFHIAGGDTAYPVPSLAAIGEGNFWNVAMVEAIGALVIAFFYSRALNYKRSAFTFAAVAAGGLALAILVGYVVSQAYLGLQSNFVFNPSAALMLQIFPTTGENFGEVVGGILQALSCYAFIPMIAGIIGFYLSDVASRLSGENSDK